MGMYKRGKTYQFYHSFQGKGKRISLHTSDYRLAKKIAADIEHKIQHEGWGFLESKLTAEKLEKLQFTKFFKGNYYPQAKRVLAKGTQVAVYGKFRRHLQPFFKDTPLNQITSNQIDTYKEKRAQEVDEWREKNKIDREGYSSINRELTILRTVLNYAVKKNYIDVHPFSKQQIDFFEERMDFGQAITREEETRLLNCADERLKPLILMALYTGRRKGEILNLTWQQVNLEDGVIQFEDKKEKQTLFVPLTNQLTSLLKELKIQKISDYVFCHHENITDNKGESLKGRTYNNIDKWWLKARKEAELIKPFKERNLRFHDLRHSFISRVRELGFNDIEVMDMTGHKDLKTLKRYTHPSSERKKLMIQLLEINTEQTKKQNMYRFDTVEKNLSKVVVSRCAPVAQLDRARAS